MQETLFESLSALAAYIAPSLMISFFIFGRQTSLVVDAGHSGSRISPIVDEYLRSRSVAGGRRVREQMAESRAEKRPRGNLE